MLRFLRKSGKQQRSKKGSESFWTFAIVESFLIFLGILIALQVDNWNKYRQDRKLERILLTEMLSDLKGDLEDIEYNMRYQQGLLNSNRVVIDFLNSELPWHDSLGIHFSRLMGGTVFDKNNSAFESLKSIGIDLVSNDSLRQQITMIYSVSYSKVDATQDMLFSYIFDHLYPVIRLNLKTIITREVTVPVNLVELRQNNGFLEDLNMTIFIYQISLGAYQITREDIIKLIAAIEQELGLDPETST